MANYIYQHKNWTDFTWNEQKISVLLAKVRNAQGLLLGKMQSLGFSLQEEALLSTLTLDVLKSSEIEGEKLSKAAIRSSIARQLGMEWADKIHSPGNVEAIVQMMLDATQNFDKPLTEERLCSWYAALFPTGQSGLYKISVAQYRTEEMQVVSGAFGKEKVHYEAVPAKDVKAEMDRFLSWLNEEKILIDNVIKSAIAHFWFVTIHPFDDGNGRIARAISDMLLARSDGTAQKFYSMSNRILTERKKYYSVLEKMQHSDSDITEWLDWFLNCLWNAIQSTEKVFEKVFLKANFWKTFAQTPLNERQIKILNKLLDGFNGVLNTSKYAKINKVSTDTALRDLQDLVRKGVLKVENNGKNTNYSIT
ncbi:MAG: Fic family protein [Candidatus Symbiothrix sp.]|jgi:Fic family protein|nr:Fic family protein [Candidatus Symbiothrix sp.]